MFTLSNRWFNDTHIYTRFAGSISDYPRLLPTPPTRPPSNVNGGEFNPLYGHIIRGYLIIKEYNITIIYQNVDTITTDNTFISLSKRYQLNSNDILIYNYGIHCNDRKQYEEIHMPTIKQHLLEFFGMPTPHTTAFKGNIDNHSTTKRPFIFLSHTTPQHFISSNGYFNYEARLAKKPCVPLQDAFNSNASLTNNDWRNQALFKHMSPLVQANLLVHGLRSQYDAHNARDGDCTHWCFPSGIDKYFHLMYYNAILNRIGLPTHEHLHNHESNGNNVNNGIDLNSTDVTWKLPPMINNKDIVCIAKSSQQPQGKPPSTVDVCYYV